MRKGIFKLIGIVATCVVGAFVLVIGGMYLFGGFNQKIVTPKDITILYNGAPASAKPGQEPLTPAVISADAFALKVTSADSSLTDDQITQKTINLYVLSGNSGIIKFPQTVDIGVQFNVYPVDINGDYSGNNIGGVVTLAAKTPDGLHVANIKILIDVSCTDIAVTVPEGSASPYPIQLNSTVSFGQAGSTISSAAKPINALDPGQGTAGNPVKTVYYYIVDANGVLAGTKYTQAPYTGQYIASFSGGNYYTNSKTIAGLGVPSVLAANVPGSFYIQSIAFKTLQDEQTYSSLSDLEIYDKWVSNRDLFVTNAVTDGADFTAGTEFTILGMQVSAVNAAYNTLNPLKLNYYTSTAGEDIQLGASGGTFAYDLGLMLSPPAGVYSYNSAILNQQFMGNVTLQESDSSGNTHNSEGLLGMGNADDQTGAGQLNTAGGGSPAQWFYTIAINPLTAQQTQELINSGLITYITVVFSNPDGNTIFIGSQNYVVIPVYIQYVPADGAKINSSKTINISGDQGSNQGINLSLITAVSPAVTSFTSSVNNNNVKFYIVSGNGQLIKTVPTDAGWYVCTFEYYCTDGTPPAAISLGGSVKGDTHPVFEYYAYSGGGWVPLPVAGGTFDGGYTGMVMVKGLFDYVGGAACVPEFAGAAIDNLKYYLLSSNVDDEFDSIPDISAKNPYLLVNGIQVNVSSDCVFYYNADAAGIIANGGSLGGAYLTDSSAITSSGGAVAILLSNGQIQSAAGFGNFYITPVVAAGNMGGPFATDVSLGDADFALSYNYYIAQSFDPAEVTVTNSLSALKSSLEPTGGGTVVATTAGTSADYTVNANSSYTLTLLCDTDSMSSDAFEQAMDAAGNVGVAYSYLGADTKNTNIYFGSGTALTKTGGSYTLNILTGAVTPIFDASGLVAQPIKFMLTITVGQGTDAFVYTITFTLVYDVVTTTDVRLDGALMSDMTVYATGINTDGSVIWQDDAGNLVDFSRFTYKFISNNGADITSSAAPVLQSPTSAISLKYNLASNTYGLAVNNILNSGTFIITLSPAGNNSYWYYDQVDGVYKQADFTDSIRTFAITIYGFDIDITQTELSPQGTEGSSVNIADLLSVEVKVPAGAQHSGDNVSGYALTDIFSFAISPFGTADMSMFNATFKLDDEAISVLQNVVADSKVLLTLSVGSSLFKSFTIDFTSPYNITGEGQIINAPGTTDLTSAITVDDGGTPVEGISYALDNTELAGLGLTGLVKIDTYYNLITGSFNGTYSITVNVSFYNGSGSTQLVARSVQVVLVSVWDDVIDENINDNANVSYSGGMWNGDNSMLFANAQSPVTAQIASNGPGFGSAAITVQVIDSAYPGGDNPAGKNFDTQKIYINNSGAVMNADGSYTYTVYNPSAGKFIITAYETQNVFAVTFKITINFGGGQGTVVLYKQITVAPYLTGLNFSFGSPYNYTINGTDYLGVSFYTGGTTTEHLDDSGTYTYNSLAGGPGNDIFATNYLNNLTASVAGLKTYSVDGTGQTAAQNVANISNYLSIDDATSNDIVLTLNSGFFGMPMANNVKFAVATINIAIQIKLPGGGGYTLTYPLNIVLINPNYNATLAFKAGTATNYTYTGSPIGPSVADLSLTTSFSNTINLAQIVKFVYTGTLAGGGDYNSSTPPTAIGTYTVTISLLNNMGENITITQATLTFTITGAGI